MIDHCSTAPSLARRVSSLHLDYGADAEECGENAVTISELGMQVRSRWRFEVGTALSLDFVSNGARCTAEVTVVSCEPVAGECGVFASTLLFLEFPEALRPSLSSPAG